MNHPYTAENRDHQCHLTKKGNIEFSEDASFNEVKLLQLQN